MKNNAPIIFLLILISIIIFCLIMFLVVYLSGGNMGILNFGYKNKEVIFDESFKKEDVKSIDIKQDAGNIIFKETSNDNIQVVAYGEEREDIVVNLSNNKLTIDYTRKNKWRFISLGNISNDIIVYIPSDYSNDIRLKSNLGDCELIDLENATLDIDCDAGNVELGKVKNANIRCDLGNVEIKEVFNKCTIRVDAGNVEIAKLSIKEDSNIKADLGNIDIKEIGDMFVDATVDLGKSNINGSNRNANVTLKLECDCGNINVGK